MHVPHLPLVDGDLVMAHVEEHEADQDGHERRVDHLCTHTRKRGRSCRMQATKEPFCRVRAPLVDNPRPFKDTPSSTECPTPRVSTWEQGVVC